MHPTVRWLEAQARQREYEQVKSILRDNSPLLPVDAGLPVEVLVAPQEVNSGVVGYVRLEDATRVVLACPHVPAGHALSWSEADPPEELRPHLTLAFLLLVASRTAKSRVYALAHREQHPPYGPDRPVGQCYELRNYAIATLARAAQAVYPGRAAGFVSATVGIGVETAAALQDALEDWLSPERINSFPSYLALVHYPGKGHVIEARTI